MKNKIKERKEILKQTKKGDYAKERWMVGWMDGWHAVIITETVKTLIKYTSSNQTNKREFFFVLVKYELYMCHMTVPLQFHFSSTSQSFITNFRSLVVCAGKIH